MGNVIDLRGNTIQADVFEGSVSAAAESVGTAELEDGAVTEAKLDDDAVTEAKIEDAAVTQAKLETQLQAPFVIVAAGQFTTAGGDANESITVAGALATDIAILSIEDGGSNAVTLVEAAAGAGAIAVVLSGDPSTDAILNYVVLRAVA